MRFSHCTLLVLIVPLVPYTPLRICRVLLVLLGRVFLCFSLVVGAQFTLKMSVLRLSVCPTKYISVRGSQVFYCLTQLLGMCFDSWLIVGLLH